jgi:hypothetical protein
MRSTRSGIGNLPDRGHRQMMHHPREKLWPIYVPTGMRHVIPLRLLELAEIVLVFPVQKEAKPACAKYFRIHFVSYFPP